MHGESGIESLSFWAVCGERRSGEAAVRVLVALFYYIRIPYSSTSSTDFEHSAQTTVPLTPARQRPFSLSIISKPQGPRPASKLSITLTACASCVLLLHKTHTTQQSPSTFISKRPSPQPQSCRPSSRTPPPRSKITPHLPSYLKPHTPRKKKTANTNPCRKVPAT